MLEREIVENPWMKRVEEEAKLWEKEFEWIEREAISEIEKHGRGGEKQREAGMGEGGEKSKRNK